VITKEQLRREISAKRDKLASQWLEAASGQIVERLQTLEFFEASETIALYMAIAGEVQLDTLFSHCWKLGKRTCIPVFNREQRCYNMAEVSADTQFWNGHYGIREPISPTLIAIDCIGLMVVPGVAFDMNGNRLGRGGGYYDRLLAGFSGVSVAVAFDFQLSPEIPHTIHDRPVDRIVTETKTVEVSNEY
jgi:5-formyltetrahydrofolate cyclo-ligase